MSTEISLEKKANFVLDYLYNNFLISKNQFIKKFNLQDYYFNHKQIQSFHRLQDDYFNLKYNKHFNYMFFDLSFHHKLEKLEFRIISSKIELDNKPFFLIELPSDEEKIKLIETYQYSDYKLQQNVLENMIKEKNKIIQTLLASTGNSFSIRQLFTFDLNAVHIEKIYELIKIEKNIKNF